jgi:phosphatidylglycerol:prolipoprotein diacylglycerol transferase
VDFGAGCGRQGLRKGAHNSGATVTFPVYIPLGPWRIHPHIVFELLAYTVGFQLYLRERRRRGDAIDGGSRWTVVSAAIVGAAIGSRLLYWLEDPAASMARWYDITYLLGGKTILGAVLGGLIAVELTKRWVGITQRTGDLFVVPICIGAAIGRIGCFLTGLEDRTYGTASSLPWAVDFGDGIRRHPTQLYEIVALLALAVVLSRFRARRPLPAGRLFQIFMVAYLSLRLIVDAIKPDPRLALGLSAIQWAALAGLVYYAYDWRRLSAQSAPRSQETRA